MLVFINAGHDTAKDSGAVNPNTGLREADVAKDISLLVCDYLQEAGLSTEFAQDDYLTGVINQANSLNADLFVSIHCNSFSNSQANGIETLYHPKSTKGFKIAECIQKQLVESLQLTDRGVKTRTDLGVLNRTDMPACLTEVAFISNPVEEQILASDEGKDTIARAIARGITDYFI